MNELNGGSDIGSGAQPRVDVLTGEILSDKGIWNDHTQSYEIITPSRVEKADGLVQQRRRYVQFARSYEQYNADVAAGDATRRLLGRDDGPPDDSEGGVRSDGRP